MNINKSLFSILRNPNETKKAKSGTGAKRRKVYLYETLFQFLRPVAGLHKTAAQRTRFEVGMW